MVPVLVSSDPLGFCRVVLSEISLLRNKEDIFFNPFCIIHTHLSDAMNQNLFFLPDVSLIEEFVPTFLNDVIHQVRLENPFLRLSVFLKAFYLEDRK